MTRPTPNQSTAAASVDGSPPDLPAGVTTPALLADDAALLGMGAELWPVLDRLSRALHVKEADLPRTLEAVLVCATRLVPGARFAGLNLLVKGRFEPKAVFGGPPHTLDVLQERSGFGPCIDASQQQATIAVPDMRAEDRWPDYANLAIELGVLSMLCVPLWVDDIRVGSLSLYGTDAAAFEPQAANIAGLLATHAALALADAQRTAHLRQALINRDVIGQAKGILMERHRLTAEQAFTLLSRASQSTNRKLVDIAEAVTLTGAIPAN